MQQFATSLERVQKLSELFKRAPKPQLHVHLDGSLPPEFIFSQLQTTNPSDLQVQLPNKINSPEEIRQQIMDMKQVQFQTDSKVGKKQNWPTFDFANQFLQTKENLFEATYQVTKNLYQEHGVNCLEIRFAPILHTQKGLDMENVVKYVSEGFNKAQKEIIEQNNTEFFGGIILCSLRSYGVEESIKTVELCKKMKDLGVIGFDLAGDEGSHSTEIHREAYELARKYDVNTTIHAGEWNESFGSIKNIELACDLQCKRIGHGLTLRSSDQSLRNRIKEQNIGLEICLTSNCGNPSKCKWYDEHPLPKLFDEGLGIAGLNVDNQLFSGSVQTGRAQPEGEILRAYVDCNIDIDKVIEMVLGGYKYSFDSKISQEFIQQQKNIWENNIKPELKEIEKQFQN